MIAGSTFRAKLLLILLATIGLALVWRFIPIERWLRGTLTQISGLGPWGPVIFVLFYVAACVCFVPGSLLTIGAGVIFGLVRGVVCVSIGSVAGACASFLIGRHLARSWVTRKIAGNLANLDSGRRPRTTADWVFGLVGLAATIGVTYFITRIARRALNKKIVE